MFSLFPREENFFVLFNEIAGHIVEASKEFELMCQHPAQAQHHCSKIKDIEHKGDGITHKTMDLLHKTFITPMDREDIHTLISRLDDVLDLIDAAGQRFFLYEIKNVPKELLQLATICTESAKLIETAVGGLNRLKNPADMSRVCVEINRLENEGDQVLRTCIARLFKEENDVRELIKMKELIELMEMITDRCEDVANAIDGIVLEYA